MCLGTEDRKRQSAGMTVEDEWQKYINDTDKSLKCLEHYPRVKEVFLRLNTILPSSAPVERLFSVAGWMFRRNRHGLSDRAFEQTMLNANTQEKISKRTN